MSARARRALAVAAIAPWGVYAACGSQPATSEREPPRVEGPSAPLVVEPILPTPAETGARPARRRGCIRGGFTPAEVRAVMGEPDSIVGGWWIYDRTQVLFGYGTLQDYIDDSQLVSC